MSTEKVTVILDSRELSDRPEEDIRVKALTEVRYEKGYRDDEVAEVEKDETFRQSCREAAERMHHMENRRQMRALRGKVGTPDRCVERLTIRFTRPQSRGWTGGYRELARE